MHRRPREWVRGARSGASRDRASARNSTIALLRGGGTRIAPVARMIFYLLVILLAMWALGLSFGVGGSLVHLILVLCAVLLLVELLQRARTA